MYCSLATKAGARRSAASSPYSELVQQCHKALSSQVHPQVLWHLVLYLCSGLQTSPTGVFLLLPAAGSSLLKAAAEAETPLISQL